MEAWQNHRTTSLTVRKGPLLRSPLGPELSRLLLIQCCHSWLDVLCSIGAFIASKTAATGRREDARSAKGTSVARGLGRARSVACFEAIYHTE